MNREPKIHKLKTWPHFYQAAVEGSKPFEIRKNDRDYQAGDYLVLFEYDPKSETFTGREDAFLVTFVLRPEDGDFGLKDGYVCMGIAGPIPSMDGSKFWTPIGLPK